MAKTVLGHKAHVTRAVVDEIKNLVMEVQLLNHIKAVDIRLRPDDLVTVVVEIQLPASAVEAVTVAMGLDFLDPPTEPKPERLFGIDYGPGLAHEYDDGCPWPMNACTGHVRRQ